MFRPALSALFPLALVAGTQLAAAQVTTIASESFDYAVGPLGMANGGSGWSTPWDSGGGGVDGSVVAPGFDPIGNKVRIDPNNGFAVCFRDVDTAPWGALTTPAGKFGVEGTTLWVSFTCQRSAGALAEFGGLSLYDDATERLFLGSPWASGVWGADDHAGTGVHTIPGSNVDSVTRLVCRIDYVVGFDRLRIWLDPATAFPGGPADLDTNIGNHLWNRMRLASGTGLPNGYDFDDIRVEVVSGPVGTSFCGPAIPNSTGQPAVIMASGTPITSLNDVTLTASQLPPGQFGYFLAGQTQGFFNPPGSQGIICLAGNIGRYNQIANIIQGPMGSIVLDLTAIPVNPTTPVQPGETWSFQCWFRDNNPALTSNFSDGVAILFL